MNPSGSQSDPGHNTELSQEKARSLAIHAGFSDARVVALPYPEEARDGARFAEWIEQGQAGSMQYLAQRNEQDQLLRQNLQTPFAWARSVVVCFASYHSTLVRAVDPAPSDAAWIARYAWSSRTGPQRGQQPSDYHKVLKKRLNALEAALHAELGEFRARSFADTGPLQERALARAAGLGWIGKNTCLIHPKLGSFGFLAVLITSLAAAPENVATLVPDRCGSCTRCLEACPTAALATPRQMLATRCISYLTIEHKGRLDPALLEGIGRQVFGCDICQDVCPWNRKAPAANDPEMQPRTELVNPALAELGAMTEAEFERQFNGSPVRRAGYAGFLRNVAVAMGNSGHPAHRERLQQWAVAEDEGLRQAALWALGKLR